MDFRTISALPLTTVSARSRLVVTGIVALALALLIGWVVWKLFFAGDDARREQAQSVVAEEAAQGQSAATRAAQERTVERYEKTRIIEKTVEKGVADVYQVPGGDASIGVELDAAGRDALCLFRAYRAVNPCAGLRRDDPGDAEGGDALGDRA